MRSPNYIMDKNEEYSRLEKQSLIDGYCYKEELRNFSLRNKKKILDAGCGTGIVSRYLESTLPNSEIHACDFSELRLKQAQNTDLNSSIHYFHSDLLKIDQPDHSYDFIFCRFVYEYLSHPVEVTEEFKRVLSPNGQICLVDTDGCFINLWSENAELQSYIETLRRNLTVDLFAGRKLSTYLKRAGFKNIKWTMTSHTFQGIQRQLELENNIQRLLLAKEELTSALGSSQDYERFCKLYIEEQKKEESTLFLNKFIASATY